MKPWFGKFDQIFLFVGSIVLIGALCILYLESAKTDCPYPATWCDDFVPKDKIMSLVYIRLIAIQTIQYPELKDLAKEILADEILYESEYERFQEEVDRTETKSIIKRLEDLK